MSGPLRLAALGWLVAVCTSGFAPQEVSPGLRVEVDLGPSTTVQAFYGGDASDALTYRMVVRREGASGRSESSQSGPVGASDTLAVSRLRVETGDHLSVHLTLSDGGGVIDSTAWSQTIRL